MDPQKLQDIASDLETSIAILGSLSIRVSDLDTSGAGIKNVMRILQKNAVKIYTELQSQQKKEATKKKEPEEQPME